ncbi:phage tail protein [Neolewinella aurantiaca]|uniref:Phage tail protein n=1 Tax=Neolewinella aurantiaca TaxID=2602767 RepID=A0A5C7FVU3_9BACT|nr:tail fiber protein [Neolewinella aurantiaca]TXF90465.1 phage tail protein [Neolewinella aurantiaca]
MEYYLGQIIMGGWNFAPRGTFRCDGQLLPIAQYTALFSLLGTTYGGDGRTTFGLPDLRGRVPMHEGTGPGLTSRPLGQRSGQESVTLTSNQIPAGLGSLQLGAGAGTLGQGGGNYLAANSLGESIFTATGPATPPATLNGVVGGGGNQSHNNMQPYLVITFCIASQGIFPSRN